MEVLAVIAARGGSKGLPGKNIRMLSGHPLLSYSILAAKQSTLITRVIVSSDDDSIINVAKQYGAEVPFKRPVEFAQDMSTDLEVFTHALSWLQKNEGYKPDLVVQLRPTSPVRTTGLIDQCIEKLSLRPEADSLRVVTEAPVTPYKMWTIEDETKPMAPLMQLDDVKEFYNMPRQSLPKVYWQIGTLDVIRSHVIADLQMMSGNCIMHHIVPPYLAVDIDDVNSFDKAAEAINKYDCVRF